MLDNNMRLARKCRKVAVTAAGMFSPYLVWFIFQRPAVLLITLGNINCKFADIRERFAPREHLCFTATFAHNRIDGAPAAGFMGDFAQMVKSGALLQSLKP